MSLARRRSNQLDHHQDGCAFTGRSRVSTFAHIALLLKFIPYAIPEL